MIALSHHRVELALHTLRGGDGTTLLILHGLGEATPHTVPRWAAEWHGPVVGLDFTGHGQSTVPAGGGYTAEILIGDVDAAIEHLATPVAIAGRGLGGYVGLLAAGARARAIVGLVIGDGPGLGGGPDEPTTSALVSGVGRSSTPDPYALIELSRDLRPADYAIEFAHFVAVGCSTVEPIQVAARFRPPWLEAVSRQPGVAVVDSLAAGLDGLA